ncbi:MAG TPA: PilZ domain-containing protein [Desulfomonilaceae bacterium]|nr:PilZ domain-containing protein [Desulfomonilaceae bacterium]
MAARRVRAKEVLQDIRSGMDDPALMEKYHLTPQGLQKLFKDLVGAGLWPERRHVNAKDVLRDIRSGVGRTELMEKHGLSFRGLQALVTLLVDAGVVKRNELYGELRLADDTVVPAEIRAFERYYLDFETPVYESGSPELCGKVLDITEVGVGLTGIEAEVNEIKRLVVLGDPFGEAAPFEFNAKCRWTSREKDGACIAGFQITDIAENDLEELRKLINLVMFSA